MKGFSDYLARRQERRRALDNVFKAVDSTQLVLGKVNTETLRGIVISRYVPEEMRDIVKSHLGPEALSSTLRLNPRARR